MGNDIEIRIVGDNESGTALRDATADVEKFGQTAETASKKLDVSNDRVRKTNRIIGEGGRAFGDYGKGLGGVGDRADEVDTRMMGLSDGIQGVTDLMGGNGKLRPHEMAMAFSDLGSSMYNTVIPTLQDTGGKLGTVIDKMGGLKTAAFTAAGAAGIGAALFAIKELGQAAHDAKIDDLVEGFLATKDAAESVAPAVDGDVFAMGNMADVFDRLLEQSPELAQAYLNQAVALGLSKEAADQAQAAIDRKTAADKTSAEAAEEDATAAERQADAIRGVTDARRAAIDPLFGMLDALEGTREAQRGVAEAEHALREAVRQHGEGSAEAAAAQRDLNAAQDDAARSAFDYESAAGELEAQIREHPASLSNAKLALERWVSQGSISEEQARRMAIRFENAADRADDVAGTRTADLRARDNATSKIQSVGNQLGRLDGRNADVYITGHTVGGSIGQMLSLLSQARVAGGPVSAAAAGGPRGGTVLLGEGGAELITNVAPGSMVNDAATTRRRLADAAGSEGLTIVWQGSPTDNLGRALFDWFRDNIRDNYGGDPQRGLGA